MERRSKKRDKIRYEYVKNIEKYNITNSHLNSTLNEDFNREHFKRFNLEEGAISTRVPLGTENAIFWNTGDEHDEYGHITEDPEIRKKMVEKRMSKLKMITEQISNKDQIKIEFEDKSKTNIEHTIIILSW